MRGKYIDLLLISLISLFCELLFIRWLTADFRSLAVLKSLPLVICFVGLGAGIALAGRSESKFAEKLSGSFVFIFYLTVVAIRIFSLTGFSALYLPSVNLYQWTDLASSFGKDFLSYELIFMVFITALFVGPFFSCMSIGVKLGELFEEIQPLKAYALNLGGALAGSLAFTLASFLCLPIWVLVSIPAFLSLYFVRAAASWVKWRSVLLCVLTVAAAAWPGRAPEGSKEFWSPYARIQVFPVMATTAENKRQEAGILLNVNQIFHQFFFSSHYFPEGWTLPADIEREVAKRRLYYPAPYKLRPGIENVLILGAGTGQDVLEALNQNVKHVDAVEIDPLVLELGRKYNKAYASDKVSLYCDDARHYVSHCRKKYDLVLLACLDSSALSGLGSSVRLDSYVHTLESAESIRKVLKPDGLFVMTFGTGGGKWLQSRVKDTIDKAFSCEPLTFEGANIFFCVCGEPVKRGEIKLPFESCSESRLAPADRLLTDDWPFLYMAPARIDWPLLAILLELVAIAAFAGRRLFFTGSGQRSWTMFFMGAAFILVELGAISRLCLVYSASWLTSAIVINVILLFNTLATVVVMKKIGSLKNQVNLLFVLLLSSLLISYLIPPVGDLAESLGDFSTPVLTVLMLLPCLFSGILFPILFAKEASASRALAFNIYGAVLGSLLEYISNYYGLRSLSIVAMILYLLAWSGLWSRKAVDEQPVESAGSPN